MTVKFDKDKEDFVLRILKKLTQVKTRTDKPKSISEIVMDIMTPQEGAIPKDDSDLRDWLKDANNLVRFTRAFDEGFEADEPLYQLYATSTMRGVRQILVRDERSELIEYYTIDEYNINDYFQYQFKLSELPNTILDSPWFLRELVTA